jgi:hypothetical protein
MVCRQPLPERDKVAVRMREYRPILVPADFGAAFGPLEVDLGMIELDRPANQVGCDIAESGVECGFREMRRMRALSGVWKAARSICAVFRVRAAASAQIRSITPFRRCSNAGASIARIVRKPAAWYCAICTALSIGQCVALPGVAPLACDAFMSLRAVALVPRHCPS